MHDDLREKLQREIESAETEDKLLAKLCPEFKDAYNKKKADSEEPVRVLTFIEQVSFYFISCARNKTFRR